MQEQVEKEDTWNDAEIIFGRLTAIHKSQRDIEFEYKTDDHDWERAFYHLDGYPTPDLGCLGKDHEFTIVSNRLTMYSCEH